MKKFFKYLLVTLFILAIIYGAYVTFGILISKFYHRKVDVVYDISQLTESSGLGRSIGREGIFYTHGDSRGIKDKPNYLYSFRFEEQHGVKVGGWREAIELEGISDVDWEDMNIEKNGRIVLGDIGNNVANRAYSVLYAFQEPIAGQKKIERKDIKVSYFKYPKKQYDSEALFVKEDNLYVITKEKTGRMQLYRLSLDGIVEFELNTLEKIDSRFFTGMVTGADISPNGNILAVLTYKNIYLFDIKNSVDFDKKVKSIPLEWSFKYRQYEGICFVDNETVLISTEQGFRTDRLDIGMRIFEYDLR